MEYFLKYDLMENRVTKNKDFSLNKLKLTSLFLSLKAKDGSNSSYYPNNFFFLNYYQMC